MSRSRGDWATIVALALVGCALTWVSMVVVVDEPVVSLVATVGGGFLGFAGLVWWFTR